MGTPWLQRGGHGCLNNLVRIECILSVHLGSAPPQGRQHGLASQDHSFYGQTPVPMLVVTHQLWNMVQSAHSWITVPWSIQQSNERPSTQDGVKRNELDFKVPERCLASEFSLLLCSYHHLVYSIQTPLLHNPSLILTSGGGTFCICFSSLPSRYPPPPSPGMLERSWGSQACGPGEQKPRGRLVLHSQHEKKA